MSESAEQREPELSIHFQGLCAFVSNHEDRALADEVTAILVAASRAEAGLCRHERVLVFHEEQFISASENSTHRTILIPDHRQIVNPERRRPALGIWPLDGKDLLIRGAERRDLMLQPSFDQVADLGEIAGAGDAHAECFLEEPPPERLIGGRVFLTSGCLQTTELILDEWVFLPEEEAPNQQAGVQFAQELRYDFFTENDPIELEARLFGSDQPEVIRFEPGAMLTVSNLCGIRRAEVLRERDFLAYYPLATKPPRQRLIPQRIPGPIRIGQSACPPSKMVFR